MKTLNKDLASAGSFILSQRNITYGYKKKLYPLNLTFSPEDYPHLAGFQYMKDISLPNYTSTKIVDRILDGKITFSKIQESDQSSIPDVNLFPQELLPIA